MGQMLRTDSAALQITMYLEKDALTRLPGEILGKELKLIKLLSVWAIIQLLDIALNATAIINRTPSTLKLAFDHHSSLFSYYFTP